MLKLEKSLYGLPREDTDWNTEADKKLLARGYEKVKDIDEDAVYLRQEKGSSFKTMVVRYSDNLTYTNAALAAVNAHQEGDEDFKFGKQAN